MNHNVASQVLPPALAEESLDDEVNGAARRDDGTEIPLPIALDLDLDTIFLPQMAFGQVVKPYEVVIVRELQDSDLAALLSPTTPKAPPSIKSIRAIHHKIAQLLAQGIPVADISLMTGTPPGAIRRLEADPSFQALQVHYTGVVQLQFVDVVERMRDLGIAALEELKERLEDQPGSFSNGQLKDLVESVLTKPMSAVTLAKGFAGGGAGRGGAEGSPPVKLEIVFKSPKAIDGARLVQGEEEAE